MSVFAAHPPTRYLLLVYIFIHPIVSDSVLRKKKKRRKIFTHARYIYTQFQTVHKEGPGQYLGQYR